MTELWELPPECGGLGDAWMAIRYVTWRGRLTGRPMSIQSRNPARNTGQLFEQIIDELDYSLPLQVNHDLCKPGIVIPHCRGHVFVPPVVQTRLHWKGDVGNTRIGLQFDGGSNAAQKNCSVAELERLTYWLGDHGLTPVTLGRSSGDMHAIVNELAACRLFISVDSGVAQVAYAVGCPAYIVSNNMPKRVIDFWHSTATCVAKTMGQLLEKLDETLTTTGR